MFEYEMATARRADLIREADRFRMVQQAKKADRAASRGQESERSARGHRSLFTRAA